MGTQNEQTHPFYRRFWGAFSVAYLYPPLVYHLVLWHSYSEKTYKYIMFTMSINLNHISWQFLCSYVKLPEGTSFQPLSKWDTHSRGFLRKPSQARWWTQPTGATFQGDWVAKGVWFTRNQGDFTMMQWLWMKSTDVRILPWKSCILSATIEVNLIWVNPVRL